MYTLKRPVRLPYVEAFPGEGELEINCIPCSLEKVVRCDTRVDLEHNWERVFLVEHVLGCLKLAGVDSAQVFGTYRDYDLTREAFRDAKEMGMPPSSVLGNPEGTLDRVLYSKLIKAGRRKLDGGLGKVKEKASIESRSGSISMEPFDGLEIVVRCAGLSYTFNEKEASKSEKEEMAKAETPYLAGYNASSLPHVVGDVLGDICGIGRISRARVVIEPREAHHRLTMGVLKKVSKQS